MKYDGFIVKVEYNFGTQLLKDPILYKLVGKCIRIFNSTYIFVYMYVVFNGIVYHGWSHRFYFIDPVLCTRQLLLLEQNARLALGVLCKNATRRSLQECHSP